MKARSFLSLLTVLLLLSGCRAAPPVEITVPSATLPAASTSAEAAAKVTDLFSDRDFRTDYDAASAAEIRLSGTTASCSSNAVLISESTVTITDEGTYVLTGTLDNGTVIIHADKQDKVHLVLNSASITCMTGAAISVLQADKVFITLADGSENILSNGGSFTAIDGNNIDGVVFSKEDISLNGAGHLSILSPGGHGIVSKDSLTVTGGSYAISCASHGICGKDDVCIADADMQIQAGKDGIHAENEDDTSLGYVYIENGSFSITAEGDGIHAGSWMQLLGGSYDILTGGGSANAEQKTSDAWGNMGGGRPGGNRNGFSGTKSTAATEDSTSRKALKAVGSLTISGGTYQIDAADDAIHTNAELTVHAGTFAIATGDDGFHADHALTVTGGSISVSKSYEGLEGLSILISGGDILVTADDDGLNAAGGTDQSGFGGFRGNDMFGGNADSFITITGGSVSIRASGDGIDSNGTLEIAGGTVTVCGPTQGDTAVLDYSITGEITGGTFIGTGAYGMAQTFSSSEQGVLSIHTGNQAANTQITLTDKNGNVVVSHTPELPFAIVILSTPEMVKGETYTIAVGTATGAFTAS